MGSTDTLYDRGNRYAHLNLAGTTVVRSTATRLTRININSNATSGLVSVHNGVTTAGELLASISASNAAHTGTYEFNVVLSGGLTLALTGNPDITAVYR